MGEDGAHQRFDTGHLDRHRDADLVHRGLGLETKLLVEKLEPRVGREKLSAALLALSRDTAEGKEVLELQRATRFIPSKAENYKGIETAARSAGLL